MNTIFIINTILIDIIKQTKIEKGMYVLIAVSNDIVKKRDISKFYSQLFYINSILIN